MIEIGTYEQILRPIKFPMLFTLRCLVSSILHSLMLDVYALKTLSLSLFMHMDLNLHYETLMHNS